MKRASMGTIKNLIKSLGGPTKLAASLDLDRVVVAQWSRRDRIPTQYLYEVYALCKKKKIKIKGEDVNAETLLQIVGRKKNL